MKQLRFYYQQSMVMSPKRPQRSPYRSDSKSSPHSSKYPLKYPEEPFYNGYPGYFASPPRPSSSDNISSDSSSINEENYILEEPTHTPGEFLAEGASYTDLRPYTPPPCAVMASPPQTATTPLQPMLPRAGNPIFPAMYSANMYTTSYVPYMGGVYVLPQQNVQVVQQQPVVDLPPTFQVLSPAYANMNVFNLYKQMDQPFSMEQQADLLRMNYLFSYVVLWFMASQHVRELIHSVFLAMKQPHEAALFAKTKLPGELGQNATNGSAGNGGNGGNERGGMPTSLSPSIQPMVSVLNMSPTTWGALSEVEVLEGLSMQIAALIESQVFQRASLVCVDIISTFVSHSLITKYQQFGISLRNGMN